MNTAQSPGDWDLTAYFPALHSEAYDEFCAGIDHDLSALRSRVRSLGPVAADSDWLDFLSDLEGLQTRTSHLRSYLGCASSADAANTALQAESAHMGTRLAVVSEIWVAVDAALARAPDVDFEQLVSHPSLADAAYYLRRHRLRAKDAMAPELEGLASALGTTGISAWWRLYQTLTGTMTFDFKVPQQPAEPRPVAQINSLMGDADPAVRIATYTGARAAFSDNADIFAGALNAISGTRLTLYERRGVTDFMKPALRDGDLSATTLAALLDTVRGKQSVCHRYLALKAKALGKDGVDWYDLEAPLPQAASTRVSWSEGVATVKAAFAPYPKLAALADEAFSDGWIDHTPRNGKRPGGFCSTSQLAGQSRIFMTFDGSGRDVSTLAHELGHAFHSRVMRDQRYWAQDYPMTLAETASTFAEQLVIDRILADPDAPIGAQLAMLDRRLKDATAFMCNIPMRFDFEHALYAERKNGEVPVERLCALMVDAQKSNYGDVLKSYDPWFWASKLHFYIDDVSFYNFPYTFGFLFSLGLFARIKAEGPSAYPQYEALLRMTGSASAEVVAQEGMGLDLTTAEFWAGSIALIEADLARFESLMEQHGAGAR